MSGNCRHSAHRHSAHEHHDGKGRGHPSSYSMHDPEVIDAQLGLSAGARFLDLGCGIGDYALRAAELVGESGSVVALDRDERAIECLAAEAGRRGLDNLRTVVADFTRPLPLADGCVDVCLIATALHMLARDKVGRDLFDEVRRVLRPGGRLLVIECRKEETSCGPPLWMRTAPDELEAVVAPSGFDRATEVDLGSTYLLGFVAV